jgi:hypothetical protein
MAGKSCGEVIILQIYGRGKGAMGNQESGSDLPELALPE